MDILFPTEPWHSKKTVDKNHSLAMEKLIAIIAGNSFQLENKKVETFFF
jgi:hypothetical protein